MKKKKRVWVYVRPPSHYGVGACSCGNAETQWSEWHNHLWCAKCGIDFVPKCWGVLDGPILAETSRLMGLDFRQYNLKTKEVRDPLDD